VLVLAAVALAGGAAAGGARETFTVVYTVMIAADDPGVARVRWDLAGIDEVRRVRLRADPRRFSEFAASGRLEERADEVAWWPEGPYAHLTYRVALRQRHVPGKGFDSWAAENWVLTRARDLFPAVSILLATGVEPHAEARARLVLDLPAGWRALAALPSDGARSFVVESRERFDRPRGWLLLGRVRDAEITVGATRVRVAAPAEVALDPAPILALARDALPALENLLGPAPPAILIVLGPDPMWRGGIGGARSFYMHAARPLRTPDRTSPYLHELFHVLDPSRPADDALWVHEGLAEYYSLELQRRGGTLDEDAAARALRSFARTGLWGRDFTRSADFALLTNSAPLVLWALDRRIRAVTRERQGLDDVVRALAAEGGPMTTARFLGATRRVAGASFDAFFRRHVYRGEPPDLSALARPRPAPSP
jgi:hypothetical protein